MKRRTITSLAVGLMIAALALGIVPNASAHEGREVGDYTISIGWRVEPAYVGVANGPEFTIAVAAQHDEDEAESHAPAESTQAGEQATEGEETEADAVTTPAADHHAEGDNQTHDAQAPVQPADEDHAEGEEATTDQPHTEQASADHATVEVDEAILNAAETLTLTVSFGNQSRELQLIADRKTPGHFFADLTPTRPGDYTFLLTGKIGDTEVDEEFSSADGEFSTIEPASDLLFPDTKADAVSLQSQIEALKAQIEALQKDLEIVKDAQE